MFIIVINHDAWHNLLPDAKAALVDHELCHIARKARTVLDPETKTLVNRWAEAEDPDSWSIREHDVEEFADIIRRHGLWETGVERFAEAIRENDRQLRLFEQPEKITQAGGL